MKPLLLAEVSVCVNKLPSLPAVVLDLIASLDDEDADVETLASKIALDQALSANTLRLANSSFYGMQRQITTVRESISVLGFQTVRSLVTTSALVGALATYGRGGFNFLAFWRNAIGSALCAKAIAARAGLNPEIAYTAGLIHDIGRLALATQFAEHYALVLDRRRQDDSYLLDAERQVLGLDHTVIGDALTRHWKFPAAMQRTTLRHHAPDGSAGDALARVIHAADAVAHALDLSNDDDDLVPAVEDAVWQSLGLDEAELATVFRNVDKNFAAACSILTS